MHKKKIGKEKKFIYQVSFETLYGVIGNYSGRNFHINFHKSRSFNQLSLEVYGYDSEDAQANFTERINQIYSLLSVETNTVILPIRNNKKTIKYNSTNVNNYTSDLDWVDGIPRDNGEITISESAKSFIEIIVDGSLTKEQNAIISASNLFHSGRKIDAQINDQFILSNNISTGKINFTDRDDRLTVSAQLELLNSEITSVLYVSSLEALINVIPFTPKRCKKCDQLSYSISKRVTDFVHDIAGEYVSTFVKKHYTNRSKFVHTGKAFSKNNYSGVSIPQLDPNSETGCIIQTNKPDFNLREYVSYCIRKTIQKKI